MDLIICPVFFLVRKLFFLMCLLVLIFQPYSYMLALLLYTNLYRCRPKLTLHHRRFGDLVDICRTKNSW
jgi:hypothetical protein